MGVPLTKDGAFDRNHPKYFLPDISEEVKKILAKELQKQSSDPVAGQPELTIQIVGCVIPKIPVDGGSGVNLMIDKVAYELGFQEFQATSRWLRMADQSCVAPVGILHKVATEIGGLTFNPSYIIIRPESPSNFPVLLGRPWLYGAGVKVNWPAKQFAFGKPQVRVNWDIDQHQGESEIDEGYTSESSITSSEEEMVVAPRRRKKHKDEHVNFLEIFKFDDPEQEATILLEGIAENFDPDFVSALTVDPDPVMTDPAFSRPGLRDPAIGCSLR
ncbi:unnamed protein product [Calypogeia fissa]